MTHSDSTQPCPPQRWTSPAKAQSKSRSPADFLFSDDDEDVNMQHHQANGVGFMQQQPLSSDVELGGLSEPEQDVVPDSSDEASTGPALDMDAEMNLDEPLDNDNVPSVLLQPANDTGAHAQQGDTNTSSRRQHPSTAYREPSSGSSSRMDGSRDADAPAEHASVIDTSITTTEVMLSQRQRSVSVRETSLSSLPSDASAVAQRQLEAATTQMDAQLAAALALAPESAAEAVKKRQRPKAKPFVGSKAQELARLEEAREQEPSKGDDRPVQKTVAQYGEQHSEGDEDDDMLLRPKNRKKHDKKKEKSVAKGNRQVIEIDDDDEQADASGDLEQQCPSRHPTPPKMPKKNGTSSAKAKAKPKSTRDIVSDDDQGDDTEREDDHRSNKMQKQSSKKRPSMTAPGLDEELLEEIERANAKDSDEDDDYDGGGRKKKSTRDRWNKKAAKSKRTRERRGSSRLASEEPPSRPSRSDSTRKTTGKPSAVFPSSKTSNRRSNGGADDDFKSDEPVPVEMVRSTSRQKNEKSRAAGKQPLSKEFVDDEDMANDEPVASTSKAKIFQNSSKEADSADKSVRMEDEEASEQSEAPSKAERDKVVKTYGKKGKRASRVIEDSEDGSEAESAQPATKQSSDAGSSKVASSPDSPKKSIGVPEETSALKGRGSNRSKRSSSPAYAVIIDNSAKKKRVTKPASAAAVASKSKLSQCQTEKTSPEQAEEDDASHVSSRCEAVAHPEKTSSKPSKNKKPVIDDSEEEEPEERLEVEENSASTSAVKQSGIEKEEAAIKPEQRQEQAKPLPLAPKAINVASPAKGQARAVEGKTTPIAVAKAGHVFVREGSVTGSTGKKFHDMVVSKGGGTGIRFQGLSKRGRVPSLLTIRNAPPPKRPPLPPAPVKKKKKGEEVYSDEDQEELNDQPEDWWDADDYHAWNVRKRKRAKAKGEIDSEDERELAEKQKKMKKEEAAIMLPAMEGTAEVEHFSD